MNSPERCRDHHKAAIRPRRETVRTRTIPIALTLVLLSAGSALADCKEPATGTKTVPMFSPPLGEVVTGAGRLQFYSAPNSNCAMRGVFVIPKDELIAYAQSNDGWTSMMYINPKTGDDVSGWVRSPRLKVTGTEGPQY